MVVEPAGVLYAGDIVQTGRVPFLNTPDANTERWLENLETVKKMSPKYIVPGHGQVSNKAVADLDFTIRYINFVRGQMKQAVESWVPFEDAYEQIDWSEYKGLPAFEESNKGNAYRVYLELENSL
jgi:glyoxylase-like metal-dependent hydrolase (beta-lactamase superfamily II)